MPFEKLQDAVNLLSKYIVLPRNADVPISILTSASEGTQSIPAGQRLIDLFLNITRGSKPSKTLAKLLKDLETGSDTSGAELSKKIDIFVNGNPRDPDKTVRKIIGENSDTLSIIKVNTMRITPAGRLVDATSMFMNMIPTLEMSRAVPYLTIEVQTKRPPLANGKVQGISLVRFLRGAEDVSSNPYTQNLVLALQTDVDGNVASDVTNSGMELFTAPQTLVDPSIELDGNRAARVQDRFRPFMSIEKLSVNVEPQYGFFSYRTATLDITLHDRTRLNEIADFIRPDLYKNTELMIEYGWSHPDASRENTYAMLLNAMRVKEKYGVVNSSFSFTKTGEVKIKLKLFTRGIFDMQKISIGDDPNVKTARDRIIELQETITQIRLRVLQEDTSKTAKEIRPEQQLFAHAEDIGQSLKLSPEAEAAVKKFIGGGNKGLTGDMQTLYNSLAALYGQRGKKGEIDAVKQTVATVIKKKFDKINSEKGKKDSDPFIARAKDSLTATFNVANLSDFKFVSKDYISFGKLMALFVGQPLSNKKDAYEDVQLIFYPFNSKAGAISRLNIAEFPIKLVDLQTGLQGLGTERGLDIPLVDFMSYIANNFIDDMSNQAYGLGNSYDSSIDKDTGMRKPPEAKKGVDETALLNRVQIRLKALGAQDGVFKMPQIDVVIETVPLDASNDGESVKTESNKTILKIHFFDKCSTAYESLGQLILASRENSLNALGNNIADPDKSMDHITTYNHYLTEAEKIGIITPKKLATEASDVKMFDVKYDFEKLKDFLHRNMPTIVYGVNNTAIEEATFSTMQEPKLSTIHMRRAGEQSAQAPAGLTRSNLPLRTLPAQVSMTTAGCPLIHYMQQFFIDFGTNTTADNIYGVNKLSHEIEPGKFFSKVELIPLDAYGRYESIATQVANAINTLKDAIDKQNSSPPPGPGSKVSKS